MEGLCPKYGFPIKHLFKEGELMKRYLKWELKPAKRDPRAKRRKEGKGDGDFPKPEACLMIFGGVSTCESKPN